MNNLPLISVVMPAYNHARFIDETINSVLNQTYDNFELIIVDDGSTDDTAKIIKQFSDPRITYHYQHNQDAFNALNNALAMTNGDIISIINSDDVYAPTRLERLMSVMLTKQAQCIFSDIHLIDDDSQRLDDSSLYWNQWRQEKLDFFAQAPDDLTRGFLHANLMVTTSNLMMTASAYKKVGNFAPLRYLHDYDYIFRLLRAYPKEVHFLHTEKLLSYRLHQSNTISEAAITGREQDQAIIREAMLALSPQKEQTRINTGIDRLLALAHELHCEHEARNLAHNTGENKASQQASLANIHSKTLLKTIVSRLLSKLTP